jgi:hypothetical protein
LIEGYYILKVQDKVEFIIGNNINAKLSKFAVAHSNIRAIPVKTEGGAIAKGDQAQGRTPRVTIKL